jgi:hypothetical protein
LGAFFLETRPLPFGALFFFMRECVYVNYLVK